MITPAEMRVVELLTSERMEDYERVQEIGKYMEQVAVMRETNAVAACCQWLKNTMDRRDLADDLWRLWETGALPK